MRRIKYVLFEKAYNGLQRPIIAALLSDGKIAEVKYSFASRKVEYTEELAEQIKAKYGTPPQNRTLKKEV